MAGSNSRGAIWTESFDYGNVFVVYGREAFTLTWGMEGKFSRRGLCLLGSDDFVDHLGLYDRQGKVATFERRIRVSHFEPFEALPLDELIGEIPARYRQFVGEGPVPPSTWVAVLDALRVLRPTTIDAIRTLESILDRPLPYSGGAARDTWAMERDAVVMALDIAGIARRELVLDGLASDPAPFIRGLSAQRIREDAVIEHDARVFGDWEQIRGSVIGAVEFQGVRGERLTVINTNRTPIESTLGVDLIYFNHRFNSYVMVQYKMLRKQESGDFAFRPTSDASLARELERMRSLKQGIEGKGHVGYRMGSEVCFLKFCKNEKPLQAELDLLDGLYVPLGYWDLVAESEALRGPRGGTVVSYDTLPRSISKTEIVDLIQGGWVGSAGATSAEIADVIREALDSERSVVLAVQDRPGADV